MVCARWVFHNGDLLTQRLARITPITEPERADMATKQLDARGLRCPQPIQAIITSMHETAPGDVLEVTADCTTFEDDVRKWAQRTGRTLLAITRNDDALVAQIQL
jgi:tRNA 2-thiouridine synthesizing protein A